MYFIKKPPGGSSTLWFVLSPPCLLSPAPDLTFQGWTQIPSSAPETNTTTNIWDTELQSLSWETSFKSPQGSTESNKCRFLDKIFLQSYTYIIIVYYVCSCCCKINICCHTPFVITPKKIQYVSKIVLCVFLKHMFQFWGFLCRNVSELEFSGWTRKIIISLYWYSIKS